MIPFQLQIENCKSASRVKGTTLTEQKQMVLKFFAINLIVNRDNVRCEKMYSG